MQVAQSEDRINLTTLSTMDSWCDHMRWWLKSTKSKVQITIVSRVSNSGAPLPQVVLLLCSSIHIGDKHICTLGGKNSNLASLHPQLLGAGNLLLEECLIRFIKALPCAKIVTQPSSFLAWALLCSLAGVAMPGHR